MEYQSNLVLCPNGHYYNAAIQNTCPICSQAAASAPSGLNSTMPVGGGAPTPGGSTSMGETIPVGGGNFGVTQPAGGAPIGVTQPAPVNDGGFTGNPGPGVTQPAYPGAMADPTSYFTPPTAPAAPAAPRRTDPVVGWFVCTEGACMGRSFEIYTGYNYIGRSEGDVIVPGDLQISRVNHAMAAYDPSENTYFLGPSAGRNLIKVNGKTIFNAVEIKSYDVVTIGATKLMFVALCGEQFQWNRGAENG